MTIKTVVVERRIAAVVSNMKFRMQLSDVQVCIYITTFVIFDILHFQIVMGEGQSLFASLGQLELLWENDIYVVKTIKTAFRENDPEYLPFKRYQRLPALFYLRNEYIIKVYIRSERPNIAVLIPNIYRYVKQHCQYKLNQTPNYNHLGHPINAYHLLRHIVYGWEYVSYHLPTLIQKRPLLPELCKY